MSAPRRSSSDDPIVRFAEDFAEAFRPLTDHLRRVWAELRPALEPLAELARAAERSGKPLPVFADQQGCHCLCGMHQAEGMFCAGYATGTIPMRGPLGLTSVSMCIPCGRWWLNRSVGEPAGVR